MAGGHGADRTDDPPKRPIARATLVRISKLYGPYRATLALVAVRSVEF